MSFIFINEITASDAGPDIIRSHLFMSRHVYKTPYLIEHILAIFTSQRDFSLLHDPNVVINIKYHFRLKSAGSGATS